eukprot:m.253738 g.253738  ORF g.253738 m.253738 type:complete len:64 (+) comp15486_c2_seq6:375-566(+)
MLFQASTICLCLGTAWMLYSRHFKTINENLVGLVLVLEIICMNLAAALGYCKGVVVLFAYVSK